MEINLLLSCQRVNYHLTLAFIYSGFILVVKSNPIQLTTVSSTQESMTPETTYIGHSFEDDNFSINGTNSLGWRFTGSGTEGFWYFPKPGNLSNSTKNEVFYTVLKEDPDCYIKSFGGEEFARIEKMFIIKRAFKKSMVQLKLRVNYEGQSNEKEVFIESSRFLKSSSKSDFKFLPWKLDHFSIIGKIIIDFWLGYIYTFG